MIRLTETWCRRPTRRGVITPPTRTRGGGKGQRLTYRYPVHGIPGAPLRDNRRRPRPGENARFDALGREFAVISLRVWLAGLTSHEKRVASGYKRWQVGTDWTRGSGFGPHLGNFSELKREASDANTSVRQNGGDPLADALARADIIRADIQAILNEGAVQQPDPVAFVDALAAVLAGPHAEAQPPKV